MERALARALRSRTVHYARSASVEPAVDCGAYKHAKCRHISTSQHRMQDVVQPSASSENVVAPVHQPSPSTASDTTFSEVASGQNGASAIPSRLEVDEFLVTIEKADVPVNSFRVAGPVRSSTALSRELDTVATLPRQIAHMLLTTNIVTIDDLANPAKHWAKSYADMDGKPRNVIGQFEYESDDITEAVAALKPGGSGESGVQDKIAAQADAAFGVMKGGAPAPKADNRPSASTAAPAPRATPAKASSPGGIDWAAIPQETLGPPVGGALSYIPAGSSAPLFTSPSSFPSTFVPTPVGTLYLHALADHLAGVAGRARKAVEEGKLAREAMAAAGVDEAAAAAAATSMTTGASLPALHSAFMASLREGAVEAFAAYAGAVRSSGSAGWEKEGMARAEVVERAAGLLRSAATATFPGSPARGLPTVGAVHAALGAAVGAIGTGTSMGKFATEWSAAAATARDVLSRTSSTLEQLNAAAAHASNVHVAHGGGASLYKEPAGAVAHVSLSASLPSVSELVGAGAGGELSSLRVSMSGMGRGGVGEVELTLGLVPPGTHSARLAVGHVPSMLAPLMAVLTPAEWEACVALIRCTRPGGAEPGTMFLPYPVGGQAQSQGGSEGVTPEVAAAARSLLHPPTSYDAYIGEQTTIGGMQGGEGQPLQPIAMTSGMRTSDMNTLTGSIGGESTLGASSLSRTHAIAHAASTAPSEASAHAYIGWVARMRTARSLLTAGRSRDEAVLEAAQAAVAAAGAGPEVLEALRINMRASVQAALAGEPGLSDEEVLANMRDAEAGMPQEVRRRMTRLPSEEMAEALRSARGHASKAEVALVEALQASAGGSAPGARSGPAATAAASAVDITYGTGRVQYGRATDGPSLRLDGSLARIGSPTPGLGGLLHGATTPSPSTRPPGPVTGLAEEDAGGVFNREAAGLAYVAGGMDLLPVPPRAHPADLATTAHLEHLAGQAVGGVSAAEKKLAQWLTLPVPQDGATAVIYQETALAADVRERLESLLAWSGSPIPGAQGPGSNGQGKDGDPLSARNAVVTVPKLGVNAAAIERDGLVGALRAADTARAVNLAHAEAGYEASEQMYLEELRAKAVQVTDSATPQNRGIPGEGMPYDFATGGSPWWASTYSPPPAYRSPHMYEPVHERMLEALQARDLGAAWALWSEHCRLHEQCGDPDVLALEIIMDGAACARRSDLVFHVLWPRAMAWRVEPTPAMGFALLKAAALGGHADMCERMMRLHVDMGWAVDGRHYSALISCHLADGAFQKAYSAFNKMLRAGHPASVQTFVSLFLAVRDAGLIADAHALWRCVTASPALALPASAYTLIIQSLAGCGLMEDVEEAIERMRRVKDGSQIPSQEALSAIFAAYVEKRGWQGLAGAQRTFDLMNKLEYVTAEAEPEARKRSGSQAGRPIAKLSASGKLSRRSLEDVLQSMEADAHSQEGSRTDKGSAEPRMR